VGWASSAGGAWTGTGAGAGECTASFA
jgi:hypothetical protein